MTRSISMRARSAIAIASLVVAGLLYAFTRSGLRLHDWLAPLGARPHVEVPPWVANVLPDALWQFSLCALVFAVWSGHTRTWTARSCIAAPVVVGLGTEVAQALHLIEGLFDPADLLAMTIATLLAAALMLRRTGAPQPCSCGDAMPSI